MPAVSWVVVGVQLEMMVETLSGLIDPPRHRLHASKAEIVAHTAVSAAGHGHHAPYHVLGGDSRGSWMWL